MPATACLLSSLSLTSHLFGAKKEITASRKEEDEEDEDEEEEEESCREAERLFR